MMQEETSNRPGFAQWLLFLGLALWLAAVPLVVTAALSAATQVMPGTLVEFGILTPREPLIPVWVFGLLTIVLTLGLELAAFVPVAPERAALLRGVRQVMADHLLKNLSAAERKKVLWFCTDQTLFAPPILDQDTLGAIAGHIVEVCEEWRWM